MVRIVDLIVTRATQDAATGPARLPWGAALLFGLAVTLIYHYSLPGGTGFDQYQRLADAFLHGRVYLIDPPPHLELTHIGDRHYVIPPPLPALLMLPYVAVAGERADQALFAAVAGGANAVVAFFVAVRLARRRPDQWWLAVLFAFGSIVWYLAAGGSVWFIAHVIAALGLNVALLEALGSKRPALIGTGIAAAFWTHLPTVLTLPFFILMTVDRWAPDGLRRWRTIRLGYLNALAAPIAIVLLANFGYNWLRFGTIADVAYRLRNNAPNEPWFERGLFHPSYIPRHVYPLLRQLPVVQPTFPYITYSISGLAIWVTTPAFLFALRAPLRSASTWATWAGIVPTALLVMSHGTTGMEQFGYRLAVDFYPLLFFLTVSGMRPPLRPIHKVAIVLSVLVNLWGMVWTRMGWKVL